ncbi:MAG: 4-hydroxy-tetrahydrodipicolinate reductase [Clostridia bacterium]|nr:4-hydroxy-tetrahydrodipicolinate reductase [Clostridia bacterium]
MLKLLISGALGQVGRRIAEYSKTNDNYSVVCGVDRFTDCGNFPIFTDFNDVTVIPDIIIDFSNPSVLDGLLKFAIKNKIPTVIATTGYSAEQIEKIKNASKEIPVFFTANMSLGINLLCSLAKKASTVLGDAFDVEIIEKHHNQKIDAPSGTAIMLGNSINEVNSDKYVYEYDRHSKRAKRSKNEIGIHSVRGGTIVGEHDVIFAGKDEVLTLSHSAFSKEVFVSGALKAADFLIKQPTGLYDMNDVLSL